MSLIIVERGGKSRLIISTAINFKIGEGVLLGDVLSLTHPQTTTPHMIKVKRELSIRDLWLILCLYQKPINLLVFQYRKEYNDKLFTT